MRDEARMKDDKKTNNDVLYHCAFSADKNDVDLHNIIILPFQSLIICSERGDLSQFSADYHSQVARNLNRNQSLRGSFWRTGSHDEVQLFTVDQLLEILARGMAAPVKLGLVDSLEEWDGLVLSENALTPEITCTKPDYCSKRNDKPEEIALKLVNCPLIEEAGLTPAEFSELLSKRVKRKVTEALEERRSRGIPTISEDEFNALTPQQQLRNLPKFRTQSDKEFDARQTLGDIYRFYRALYRYFRSMYREALNTWRTTPDKNTVVFPHGTLKMSQLHNVEVSAPIPDCRYAIQIE